MTSDRFSGVKTSVILRGWNVEHRTSNIEHRKGKRMTILLRLAATKDGMRNFRMTKVWRKSETRNPKFETEETPVLHSQPSSLNTSSYPLNPGHWPLLWKIPSHHLPFTTYHSRFSLHSSSLIPLIPFHSKINNRQSSIVNEIGGVSRDGLTIEDC